MTPARLWEPSTSRVASGTATLATRVEGDPDAPVLLLLSGSRSGIELWDPGLLGQLRAERRVVAYDHRDVGDSTHYPLGSPDYSFDDMVGDAVAVLDAVTAGPAHVMGVSLGGGIGQRLAVERPDRVSSLVLVATSPGLRPAAPLPADLSPMDAEILARYSGEPFVPEHNHDAVDPGAGYRERLREIVAPTLVVHGAEDPLFGVDHGRALADEIPRAEFLELAGVGHEPPPARTWARVVPRILGLADRPGGF